MLLHTIFFWLVQDPKAVKPDDWDEREKIPDPEDKKPEGWDDIPATIVDPEAKKPGARLAYTTTAASLALAQPLCRQEQHLLLLQVQQQREQPPVLTASTARTP